MRIRPMLSIDVIKRYIDNIDEIQKEGYVARYDKQEMTEDEINLYERDYSTIESKLGLPNDTIGGIRRII